LFMNQVVAQHEPKSKPAPPFLVASVTPDYATFIYPAAAVTEFWSA